ncbi:MAG: penicillin-binding transpeptidase domain-containing protein, partial [Firmicutes bacterium]|nr:penicillin-binding transpeptidase domain-containing protein [Bacillota bacterium]
AARLVDIQAIRAAELKRRADDAHLRGVPLAPWRGLILARDGQVLADNHHIHSLYAVPVQTRGHRQEESVLLATILGVPASRLRRRLERRQGFVWLKRRLSDVELAAVRAQLPALPGVHLTTEVARHYPQGTLAAPLLGFTGVDNQGLAGLEFRYNQLLAGRPGAVEEEVDVVGKPIARARQVVRPARPGDSLVLSLDLHLQAVAEQAAAEAMVSTGARTVSIIALDPRTGGVLAWAQRPSFDPNRYREFPSRDYRIWGLSDAIPPGSIFKPVTVAAALATGAATPGSGYFCPGFKVVLGRRVNCWRPEGHGSQDLAAVVRNSCNVGFMDLGLALGVERFYAYLERFGLNRPTGIDLPGEAVGIIPAAARVTALDLAVMAFGQTLTVTPIGLLAAVAALANGGLRQRPHLVDRVVDAGGRTVRTAGERPLGRAVPPEVAALVQEMMVGVVSQGTGKMGAVPGYRVAGKTGTAQKVVGGRVVKGVYIASFVGFAPVPGPRVAMMVNVDEPQGAFYGGQVAAPIFSRVMRAFLTHLGVPPTEPVRPPKAGVPAMVPNLVNLDAADAVKDAEAFGFPVQFVGRGRLVVHQSLEYGGWYPAGTVITATLGSRPRVYLEWVTVPRFVGLSWEEAAGLAFTLGLNVRAGVPRGRVREQDLPPGRQVKAGTTIRLVTA